MTGPLRYVALGDSYTIGTGVGAAERWPDRLVARLAGEPGGPPLALVANLAANGRTSGDVLAGQVGPAMDLRPGFVTLQAGTNDVLQGVREAAYRANVEGILDALLARLPARRVVAVETPDYTVTPRRADFGDPALRRDGIGRVNAILGEVAAARGVAFVDGILAISRDAAWNPALLAADGLHPSGAQYRRWVELRIEPVVRALLAEP